VRTTLNISDDLLAEAKVVAARTHRSIGAVVDDALRVLLRRDAVESKAEAWTFPISGAGGLQPGVNLDDREALADLLGENALP
jgi:plasmid stability protein